MTQAHPLSVSAPAATIASDPAAEPRSRRPLDNPRALKRLMRLEAVGADFIKTEHLYEFDGERGRSLGQCQ